MNIVREDIDALNAILTVQITSSDYTSKVKNALEKHRKTAKIPGFRPGHVPMGLIQKQVGKSVLAEELNNLTNKALNDYIQENNLNLLGNPIPKSENGSTGDFDKPEDFSFSFEIGFSPAFELPISNNTAIDYPMVNVDSELVDKQIEDIRRRYGKLMSVEEVGEKDMVLGKFESINEDGTLKENGISHTTTISLEFLAKPEALEIFKGKKNGVTFPLDPVVVAKDQKDMASLIGVKEEELANINDSFQFTITDIKRMEMADLNAELFEKLFVSGEVSTEEELKERVASDLSNMFSKDSDALFTRFTFDYLMENTSMDFPVDFLKRWIVMSSEKPVTFEEIENDFDGYLKSLKWQLIQTKIFRDNQIQVPFGDVIEYTKGLIASNYAQYGIPAPEDEELTKSASELLKNKEQLNGIYDRLAETKLTEYFKNTITMVEKKMSYDEFVALAKG
jgi:trigger factor